MEPRGPAAEPGRSLTRGVITEAGIERFSDRPAVPRRIVGFHQDAEGHWVAELACGHMQHVRHDPPWQDRRWVISAEERAQALGWDLWCVRCAEGAVPMTPDD